MNGKVQLPNTHCPICDGELHQDNVSRWDYANKKGQLRLDSLGRAWCNDCSDKHDAIDWDAVAEGKGEILC